MNNSYSNYQKCKYVFSIIFVCIVSMSCMSNIDSVTDNIQMAYVSENDKDGDGIDNDSDNCLDIYNPNQFDSDGNAKEDVCDNTIIYYVSPTGDDNNAGNEMEPFKTINHARDILRRTIDRRMTANIVILIRGGKYNITYPIHFAPEDSGNNGYKIYYRNFPGEKPILIGGQRIVNWIAVDDFIYKTKIGNMKFSVLYENDNRAVIAREPDGDYALAEPGEFYIDHKGKYLFYRPRKLPINEQIIIAPAVSAVLIIEGKGDTKVVHDIVFSGLTIAYTDDLRNVAYKMRRHSDNGAITIRNAESIVVNNVHLHNIGTNAIFLHARSVNNSIYNNSIEKVAYSGISIEGSYRKSSHNIIANNIITDIGEALVPANGIEINSSGYNKIYHNKIARTSYAGIALRGYNCESLKRKLGGHINCADGEKSYADPNNYRYHNKTKYNEIKFNDISQFMLNADDGGGIYAWETSESIIDNNVVYEAGINNMAVKGIFGIYIDDGSDYYTIQNNIVYDLNNNSNNHVSMIVPFYIKGIFNRITNNIFISNDCNEIMTYYAYGNVPSHNLTFRNNIYYRQANTSDCRSSLLWTFRNFSRDTLSYSDYNVFFDSSNEASYNIAARYRNMKEFDILNFKEWTKPPYNFDRNSLNVSPQFEDESINNYNVTNQQILDLGFQNIDVSNVGFQDSFEMPLIDHNH